MSALRLGAQAGAPLQIVSFFYFYERNLAVSDTNICYTITVPRAAGRRVKHRKGRAGAALPGLSPKLRLVNLC